MTERIAISRLLDYFKSVQSRTRGHIMPIRIELDRKQLEACLDQRMQSLQRASNKEQNKLIQELQAKDIALIAHAKQTITEVK